MDPNLRASIAEALNEEFRHQGLPGLRCARCGASDRPLAVHTTVFLAGNPGFDGLAWHPQATSYAPLRGAPALCDRCAPPCSKCHLPYVDRELGRWLDGFPGRQPANGICEHWHLPWQRPRPQQ